MTDITRGNSEVAELIDPDNAEALQVFHDYRRKVGVDVSAITVDGQVIVFPTGQYVTLPARPVKITKKTRKATAGE